MKDEYFGVKELYSVVLKAKTPMHFGSRYIEEGEPVLYFENISVSMLSEQNAPIMARGGWANLPRVIWENRSEVQFTMSEGVLSAVSMGILLSANVGENKPEKPLLAPKREGPFYLNSNHRLYLEHWPVGLDKKKTFIFEFDRDVAQKKVYGKRIYGVPDPFDGSENRPCVEVYEDKELQILADTDKQYIVDYYYEYKKDRKSVV